MALRAAITTRVAVRVRGISRITSCGVLSSFISFIRRSSVVLNTAMAPCFKDLPANKSRQIGRRLFGLLAAIFSD
jgi:hypothetical protein